MAETLTTPRLMAAAKEFNIGKDTLVDFLVGKGFDKDELKPTSKLTEEMYRALQNEFQSDKVAKMKSVQIDLPKGAVAEAKKKKDEEDLSFHKVEKKVVKKEEPAPPVQEVAPPPPVQEIAPPPPPQPEPEPEPQPEPEVVKLETPEIEGPKVVDKIDLSAIDSSTRPKKATKKTKKTEAKEEAPKPAPEVEQPVAEAKVEVPEETTEEEPVIENIKAEKIEGPKILGKIDLPVDSDTRPKIDEKRKRKRIPIEKKDVRPEPFRDRQQGGAGQGGQG